VPLLLLTACVVLMDRPPLCPDHCPGHTRCTSAGTCPSECDDTPECEDGYYCDWIFYECLPVCVDEECADGYVCDGDTGCNTWCEDRSDCKDGYRCNDFLECEP